MATIGPVATNGASTLQGFIFYMKIPNLKLKFQILIILTMTYLCTIV